MQIKISHQSVIPLHEQLHNQLRQSILSGRWSAGYRLPSETELQHQLKISRSTIRQALQRAEVEGLIERVPGRGTFVAQFHTRNGRSPIAFVTFDFESEFQHLLLTGAEMAARSAGYRIIFCNSSGDIREESRLLDRLKQDNVAGILLWSILEYSNPGHWLERLQSGFPPVTLMDRTFKGLECDFVASDNFAGAYAATKHLLELGHQNIVFLSCRILDLLPVTERLRGYRTALQDAGLVPREPWLVGEAHQELSNRTALLAYGDPSSPHVQQIVDHLKTTPNPPTAIFTMNDNLAFLAMKAAYIAGLSVPDELSIVGFDDVDLASYLEIPLTTVAQDTYQMGKRAAELLIERIEGNDCPPRWELLPTQLRVRASTTITPLTEAHRA
jgi:GntR family transcriptional regulator, arabinose operon transcriptional repressor